MKNNVFLTVTDIMGRVIVSQSAGSCKITTKKKKRSPETLKAVATSTAKLVRAKNIRYIFRFFNVNPSGVFFKGRFICIKIRSNFKTTSWDDYAKAKIKEVIKTWL
jgi:hypothetical protein